MLQHAPAAAPDRQPDSTLELILSVGWTSPERAAAAAAKAAIHMAA